MTNAGAAPNRVRIGHLALCMLGCVFGPPAVSVGQQQDPWYETGRLIPLEAPSGSPCAARSRVDKVLNNPNDPTGPSHYVWRTVPDVPFQPRENPFDPQPPAGLEAQPYSSACWA